MLITRAALDAIGPFDAEAFPRGYGEENDFCQRAIRAGFVNLIADDTFVFHEGGMSFGEAAAALLERNLREVARRLPELSR
jgi:GT2 family glycosyltransferase